MRSKAVKILALVLLFSAAGVGLAQQQAKKIRVENEEGNPVKRENQQSPPKKSKLEEMLAEALKNNPDIRVAAANLALAEAELNRARVQMTQKVVTLHHAILSQQAEVDYEQKRYNRAQQLVKKSLADPEELAERSSKLAAAKAKLAELEAQMAGLLGKAANEKGDADAALNSVKAPKVTSPLAERMRKALQTPIKVDYKDVPFTEVLKDLEKKAPGLSFHTRELPWTIIGRKPGERAERVEAKVTLHFDMPLPIAAILQAIEDKVGSHFFVRDYGILVTMRTDAQALPPGGISVQEFMRQQPAAK